MEIPWILPSHFLPPNIGIQQIGPHSATASSLRWPNFFTRDVKCWVQTLIVWWSYGWHILHCEIQKICPLWTLRLSLTIGICTVPLMQYQLVACHGRVSPFHLMVPSLRIWVPHHGWKQDTKYGLGNLAYSSRKCWRTPTLKTPLIMHHIGNMIHTTNIVIKILCQVTGHGNRL